MPDVPVAFFSYSRDDSEFALRLASDLKAAGSAVWIDQLDIGPGQLWDRAVQSALENCPCMLLILSPASANSDNVMDEVNFALEQKKTVIPVLYRECDIPFRIRRFQHLDFRNDYDRMLQELKKCLHISGPQAASEAPAKAGPQAHDRTTEAVGSPGRPAAAPPSTAPTWEAPPAPHPPQQFPAPEYTARVPPSSAAAYSQPKPASSKFPTWAKITIGVVAALFLIGVIVNLGSNSNPQQSEKTPVNQKQSNDDMNSPSFGDFTAKGGSPTGAEPFELVRTALTRDESPPPCRFPQKSESSFSVDDAAVWYVFAYRGGSADDDWTIDWVRPNGETAATQHIERPIPGRAIYCYYMQIAGYSRGEGEWGVRLNRNGTQINERAFRISR